MINKIIIFPLLLLLWNNTALAGSFHSCRHTIKLDQHEADGKKMEAMPGDTICIEAGRRPFLRLENFEGSEEKPITFLNCKGKSTLGGPAVNDGIKLLNSRYVRISGSGDPEHPYGIHIVESKPGSQGIAITRFSSDVEIDHIEIEKAGFAGIMAKTDPYCDGSADRGNFTMYNIHLHDNYIHDVKGEGIYLGNSFYTGTKVYCDSWHLPHEVKGVRIYNNKLENTGWEAIQVGSATEDCEVYNNHITNYGAENKRMQNNGIQLGLGTTGRVYNNYIREGTGAAIVIQGTGDNFIYNNIIIAPGEEAFNINLREPKPEKGVYIINNTVINARQAVIREHVNPAKNNVFFNNLIVGSASSWNQLKHYTDWKLENNLVSDTREILFVNCTKEDFRLKANSKAIDAGKDVSAYGIKLDFEGSPRPRGEGYDVGALERDQDFSRQ